MKIGGSQFITWRPFRHVAAARFATEFLRSLPPAILFSRRWSRDAVVPRCGKFSRASRLFRSLAGRISEGPRPVQQPLGIAAIYSLQHVIGQAQAVETPPVRPLDELLASFEHAPPRTPHFNAGNAIAAKQNPVLVFGKKRRSRERLPAKLVIAGRDIHIGVRKAVQHSAQFREIIALIAEV